MYLLCLNNHKFKSLKKFKYLINLKFLIVYQLSMFKAFNMFDQDRDGTISADDLKEIYSSLGKN